MPNNSQAIPSQVSNQTFQQLTRDFRVKVQEILELQEQCQKELTLIKHRAQLTSRITVKEFRELQINRDEDLATIIQYVQRRVNDLLNKLQTIQKTDLEDLLTAELKQPIASTIDLQKLKKNYDDLLVKFLEIVATANFDLSEKQQAANQQQVHFELSLLNLKNNLNNNLTELQRFAKQQQERAVLNILHTQNCCQEELLCEQNNNSITVEDVEDLLNRTIKDLRQGTKLAYKPFIIRMQQTIDEQTQEIDIIKNNAKRSHQEAMLEMQQIHCNLEQNLDLIELQARDVRKLVRSTIRQLQNKTSTPEPLLSYYLTTQVGRTEERSLSPLKTPMQSNSCLNKP